MSKKQKILNKIGFIIMIFFIILSIPFIIDPSMFSASLIEPEIFRPKQNDFVSYSEKKAGILPKSPFFNIYNFFHDNNTQEEIFLLFAKTLKSSQKNKENADLSIKLFWENLAKKSNNEKKLILTVLSENLKNSHKINSQNFPYIYEVFNKTNQENILINKLSLKVLKNGKTKENLKMIKTVFENLDKNPEKFNKITDLKITKHLKLFKKTVLKPNIKKGEILHSAPSKPWYKNNEVFIKIK
jgi:Ca2+-binding EF-hand superfamily protein